MELRGNSFDGPGARRIAGKKRKIVTGNSNPLCSSRFYAGFHVETAKNSQIAAANRTLAKYPGL
jgi:hypothetical protein